MATIVKTKNSNVHGILVGVGFGMFATSKPGMFFGNLTSDEKSGQSEMAAVSTAEGEILWCETADLTIVSVDGEKPSALLKPYFKK